MIFKKCIFVVRDVDNGGGKEHVWGKGCMESLPVLIHIEGAYIEHNIAERQKRKERI